jgi:hypothetical protein
MHLREKTKEKKEKNTIQSLAAPLIIKPAARRAALKSGANE